MYVCGCMCEGGIEREKVREININPCMYLDKQILLNSNIYVDTTNTHTHTHTHIYIYMYVIVFEGNVVCGHQDRTRYDKAFKLQKGQLGNFHFGIYKYFPFFFLRKYKYIPKLYF